MAHRSDRRQERFRGRLKKDGVDALSVHSATSVSGETLRIATLQRASTKTTRCIVLLGGLERDVCLSWSSGRLQAVLGHHESTRFRTGRQQFIETNHNVGKGIIGMYNTGMVTMPTGKLRE